MKTFIKSCSVIFAVGVLVSCGGGDDNNPDVADTPSNSPPNPASESRPVREESVRLRETLFGTWQVRYEDRVLGVISGTVKLDPLMGKATFEWSIPETDEKITQVSNAVSLFDDGVSILLPRGGVSSGVHEYGVAERIEGNGHRIQLALGDGKTDVQVSAPSDVQEDITIDLVYDDENDWLSGYWSQAATAEAHPTMSPGRAGHFDFGPPEEGGANIVGRESWFRPAPDIKGTFAIVDQFAASPSGPDWPYPYVPGSGEVIPGGSENRFLYVVGKFLPENIREEIVIESLDPNIRYRVFRVKDSYENVVEGDTFRRDAALDRIAMFKAVDKMAYETDDDDGFMIIEALMSPGVMPGYKALKINGTETEWLLRFGDHFGQVSFARDYTQELKLRPNYDPVEMPIRTENTDTAFQEDELYVEVQPAAQVPMTSFSVVIMKSNDTVNWEVVLFDGVRELVAAPDDPARPSVFRTSPILLVDKPGQVTDASDGSTRLSIQVEAGDILRAFIVGDPVFATAPGFAQVPVLNGPEDVHSMYTGETDAETFLWPQAVDRAMTCAGVSNSENLEIDKVARRHAESFYDFNPIEAARDLRSLVTEGKLSPTAAYTVTNVTIGEHAAMMLSRQMMVDLMRAALPALERKLDDDALLALHASLKNDLIWNVAVLQTDIGNIGLNKVRIPKPGKFSETTIKQCLLLNTPGTTTLDVSYYDDFLRDTYDLDAEQIVQYKIDSMRSARANFATAIRDSIDRGKEVDDCDIYELIKLTGPNAKQVQRYLAPVLMVKNFVSQDSRNQWMPDWDSRIHAASIDRVWTDLTENEAISSSQFAWWFNSISIATFPISPILGSSLRLKMALAVFDVTDVGQSLYNHVEAYGVPGIDGALQKERRFALGAAAVFGTDRFDRTAEINRLESFAALSLTMSLSAMGTKDFFGKQNWAAYFRTDAAYRPIVRPTVSMARRAWSVVPQSNMKDAINAMAAKAVQLRQVQRNWLISSLESGEINFLNRVSRIETGELTVAEALDINAPLPAARRQPFDSLGTAIEKRSKIIRRRAQVRDFMARHPEKMEEYILDDDALRLLHLKHDSFEAFEAAVRNVKESKFESAMDLVPKIEETANFPLDDVFVGQGVYFSRIHAGNPGPGARSARMDIHSGRGEANYTHATIERAVVPDTQFGTGGMLYRLDSQHIAKSPSLNGPASKEATLTLDGADLQDIPLGLAAELRVAKYLDIGRGDRSLSGFYVKNSNDRLFAAEYSYMQKFDVLATPEELIERTTWYRNMQILADTMGYKVSGVKLAKRGMPAKLTSVWDAPVMQIPTGAELRRLQAQTFAERLKFRGRRGDDVELKYDPDGDAIVETHQDIVVFLEPK